MNFTLHVWRQKDKNSPGKMEAIPARNILPDMSFLEMLDIVNDDLVAQGKAPIAFDHDCREGICGSCSLVINGRPHGPTRGTSCQTYMRHFKDGDAIYIEPWRAKAFPVLCDLITDRTAFDRIIQAGGYVSVNTGGAVDGNSLPVGKDIAEKAMDASACIGCGACVAACKNASAMLFVAAKVSHLGLLPQGQPERSNRALAMVTRMDAEGFGNCTNQYECEAVCPKEISADWISRLDRDYIAAAGSPRGVTVTAKDISVSVDLAERPYPIRIGRGSAGFASFLTSLGNGSLAKGKRVLLAHDSRLAIQAQNLAEQLIEAGWRVGTYPIPSGEASKDAAQLQALWTTLASLPADRSTPVIALGGGVVGDLAGFAAATFNRGLPLVMIPTTLLSMVDSSVGGKTGINLPEGKNLVGSFHQPAGVWIDLDHLTTLPPREAASGLAEVVKYGVILDPTLLDTLEQNADFLRSNLAACPATAHLVARSCELKAAVVRDDERETTGLRAILNYGHTFAHGFETVLGYGAWLHGEAVSAGMVCAAELAHRIGYLQEDFRQRQTNLLDRLGLPTRVPKGPLEPLLAVMRRDKKNQGGAMRFVLPQKPGKVELISTVPEALTVGVLHDLMD